MIVDKRGIYETLEDIPVRTSFSVCIIPKGKTITITQIDKIGHQVIGIELQDWTYWDLPVKMIY